MDLAERVLEKLLNTEYHFLQYQDKYILYATSGKATLLNDSALKIIEWIVHNRTINEVPESFLRRLDNAFSEKESNYDDNKINDRNLWSPTVLTVSLTNGCTLRCKYCYARAGDCSIKFLNLDVLTAAIDIIIENAKRSSKEIFKVHFLGNGESTYNWKQFRDAVEIIRFQGRKSGLTPVIHVTTNGIFNDSRRRYLTKNIDSLTLSIDGLAEHQNELRPLPNGKQSWGSVFATAKYFFKHHDRWGFRITVTDRNVGDIYGIVKFLIDTFPGIPIRFEPLHYCGRSLDTDVQFPGVETFILEYLRARNYANEHKTIISYSGVRAVAQQESTAFCGISTPNFCLTENGVIVACFSGLNNIYSYGYFDENQSIFIIDKQKIKQLQCLSLQNAIKCKDCFAKLHCLGDCPSLRITSSREDIASQYAKGVGRCEINRALVLAHIISHLKLPLNPQSILKGGENHVRVSEAVV